MSEETNRDVLLLTHTTLFLPSGGMTLASNAELWNRLYVLAALWELSLVELRDIAREKTSYLFQDWYHSRAHDAYFRAAERPVIPTGELAAHLLEFSKMPSDFARTLAYPLDYLLVGPREEAISATPAAFAAFPLVYNADGVRIYRFNYGNGI